MYAKILFSIIFLLYPFIIKGYNKKITHIPKPIYVNKIEQPIKSLDGNWLFNPQPPTGFEYDPPTENNDGWQKLRVPSEWYMHSFEVEKHQWAGYFKKFTLPKDWEGKSVYIHFGAVNSECKLYINGKYAGKHIGTMTEFSFDITPYIIADENSIALYVRSESDAESLSKISYYAKHQVGGILRRVSLFAVPKSHLLNFSCKTDLNETMSQGIINISLLINKLSPNTELEILLKGRGIEDLIHDNTIYKKKRIKVSSLQKDISFIFDSPQLWHSETPYLYTLEVHLLSSGIIQETVSKNIGFRKIEIKGNVLLVNKTPIKLYGIARHDIHPYEGRAITDITLLEKDIKIFQNANCNYLRTAHYPPDSYLLDLCDRLGIFVEDEAPACWNFDQNTPTIANLQEYCFQSMLERDCSHPSILMWSIANESKWAPEFERCMNYAKIKTPGIPVKFSHSGYFGIIKEVDFESRHYPGWKGLKKYTNHFRPVIFDEALHLNCYNTSENTTDPGLRDLWGEYLKYFTDEMQDSPAITGLAIWSAIDEMFYPRGKHPIGYGPWGIIDGFRRPKPEYWHVKMCYSPIQIKSKTFESIQSKTLIQVENRYNIKNLKEVNIYWKDGKTTGCIHSDIAARSKGTILIDHKMQSDTLEIKFEDKRGFTISEWRIPRPSPKYNENTILTTIDSVSLQMEQISTTITTGGIKYNFSHETGMPIIIKNGDTIINSKTNIYLIPMQKENEAIDYIPQNTNKETTYFISDPLVNWKKDSISITKERGEVTINLSGKYNGNIPVRFRYIIDKSSKLKVYYIVNLASVKEKLRQIGIGFDVDNKYQKLVWEKDALWSIYPSDHIGRPLGTTYAFYPQMQENYLSKREYPSHSYAVEGNQHGSNDFRSTKHHIKQCYLSDLDNHKIIITSNGKQHFRSWINGNKTSFLVANYSNGGNEHYLSFDSDRTRYFSELDKDGQDFAGWIELSFN